MLVAIALEIKTSCGVLYYIAHVSLSYRGRRAVKQAKTIPGSI